MTPDVQDRQWQTRSRQGPRLTWKASGLGNLTILNVCRKAEERRPGLRGVRGAKPYICLRLAGLLYSAALACPCPHLSNDHTIKWLWWRSYKGNAKIPISLLTISDISEMYPLFVCWRLIFTSKALKSKIFPVAILSVAAFIVIAIIACTAKKAFDEQTWTAFAVLLVVSIQVLP